MPIPDGAKVSELPRRETTQAGDRVVVYTPAAPTLKERVVTVPLALLGGGVSGALAAALTVSLAGGKTWGTIKNGDVLAAGTTFEALFRRALIEAIYPAYAPAGVGLAQSAPADGEVGESVSNVLTATFAPGDAGALGALRIYRNGALVPNGSSSSSSPFSVAVPLVRALAPVVFQAFASYAAGARKPVPPAGTPDDRPAQAGRPDAPQAAGEDLASNAVAQEGHYRLFWGPCPQLPTDSAAVRALPATQLTSQGLSGVLVTGTTARAFVLACPPGYRLATVVDTSNQNTDITGAYVEEPPLPVNDAAATPVPGYRRYLLQVADPYANSARHAFTFLPA